VKEQTVLKKRLKFSKILKKVVKAIKPINSVPIHTFEGEKYKNIFNETIVELKDE